MLMGENIGTGSSNILLWPMRQSLTSVLNCKAGGYYHLAAILQCLCFIRIKTVGRQYTRWQSHSDGGSPLPSGGAVASWWLPAFTSSEMRWRTWKGLMACVGTSRLLVWICGDRVLLTLWLEIRSRWSWLNLTGSHEKEPFRPPTSGGIIDHGYQCRPSPGRKGQDRNLGDLASRISLVDHP